MLVGETCFGVGMSFYGVGSRTLFQTRTASTSRGRVIGSSRVLARWCVAAAGPLGGSIGAALGLRSTLIVGAVGMVFAISLIIRPRVWTAHAYPGSQPGQTTRSRSSPQPESDPRNCQ